MARLGLLQPVQNPRLKKRWQTPCFGKLNALEWQPAVGVRSYGVDIALRTNDKDFLPTLLQQLPSDVECTRAGEYDAVFSFIKGGTVDRVRTYSLAYHDHTRIARSHDLSEAMRAFTSWFRLVVGFLAPSHVFIHAGVVSHNGHAIVLPGRTLAGKSTLVHALLAQGALYMSDDYAVLEEDGTISPYSKPLSLRGEGFRQFDVAIPDDKVEHASRPPALIVFSRYEEGAGWVPEHIAPGRALLGLLDNSLGARRVPEQTTRALKDLVLRAPAFAVTRGEADIAARAILDMCDRPAVPAA